MRILIIIKTIQESGNYRILRNVKLKKIQLRKIVILLALSVTPSVYASELGMMPLGVANAVRLDISFTNSTGVTRMGLSSDDDPALTCGNRITSDYLGGPPFALGALSPRVAYFNGHLPWIAAALELCLHTTSGTIAMDGILTELGACSLPINPGCYSYTCDHVGGTITGITQIYPFTATCP